MKVEGIEGKKKRDRHGCVPGKKRQARQDGGCTAEEECEARIRRSEGRLKQLNSGEVARLMVQKTIEGDMGALRLALHFVGVMGPKLTKEEKIRRFGWIGRKRSSKEKKIRACD
jgi:hypothetical protein